MMSDAKFVLIKEVKPTIKVATSYKVNGVAYPTLEEAMTVALNEVLTNTEHESFITTTTRIGATFG